MAVPSLPRANVPVKEVKPASPVADLRAETDQQKWDRLKKTKEETGQWLFKGADLKAFVAKLRNTALKGILQGTPLSAEIIREARHMKFPLITDKGGTRPLTDVVAQRVIEAKNRGESPDPEDIKNLRSRANGGRLSKVAERALKANEIDIGIKW